MWWLILITCVLIAFNYLLFAPFFVEVDSTMGLFRVRFHRLASATLIFKESSFFIEIKMVGWQKQIDLLAVKTKEGKPTLKKERKKKKQIKAVSFRKILAVIRSFRIRKFFVTLDTGDRQLNGILYPLFVFLSVKSGKNITVNFLGENKLIFQIENNFARILWVYTRS